jgi:hypothetical protein
MLMGHSVVQSTIDEMEYDCIITSACDGTHSPTSLHYSGNAIDYRTKHLPDTHKMLLEGRIQSRIGKDFDVILEDMGNDNEHLHVEYQPKKA